LGEEIPIVEGLELSKIQPGNYRLIAFPLLLGGAEASPVRAVLIEE
jgi:arylformamidase